MKRLKSFMKKKELTTLVLIVSLFMGSILFAQEGRITKRVMTEQEFDRLKEKEGVYEEGKNYNVIINGHGTGLKPPTAEQWEEMRKMPITIDEIKFPSKDKYGAPAAPPTSWDNSATIWFPPIGTQDGEGSCVSWACGYYTKTFQEAKEHNWDLSGCVWEGGYYGHPGVACQDKIFSPDFIYHQVNDGTDNGSCYSDNMNLLERIGCSTWDKMPYDPANSTAWPGEDAWRQAPWYRSQTGYNYMWVQTDTALENLKQLLANGNLAVISVDADHYDSLTANDFWTLDNYNPSGTNHANTIVGYDDNYGPYTEAGNSNTHGAFKVANSWLVGGWENVADGFYYVSYECMKQRIEYAMFYENLVGYEPEVIAVFQFAHNLRGECETTFGIGDIISPDSTKRFDDYYYNGGDHPFPSNNMVMDITEFMPYMSGCSDNFFLKIYDDDSATTGTIDLFSIERYDDYNSGPTKIYTSTDPPVSTVNLSTVSTQVTTDTPTADAGASDTICSGTCTALNGSATGGASPYTYSWSPTTGLSNPNDSTTNACPTTTTTYTLTATDSNGCTDDDQVAITVNEGPTANAGANDTICSGTCTTLNGSASGGIPSYAYSWNPTDSIVSGTNTASPTVCPNTTTIYTLTVTDNSGCTDDDRVVVVVQQCPTITGTVLLQKKPSMPSKDHSNIQITTVENPSLTAFTDSSGSFSLTVPVGNYTLKMTKPGYLRDTQTVNVSADVNIGETTLLGGDYDQNNGIGWGDVGPFINSFGSVPGNLNWNEVCDFDQNNGIGWGDAWPIIENFGKGGD